MNTYVVFAAVVVAVLAFIQNGDAVQCWVCQSELYGACGENFNASRYPRISTIQSMQNRISDFPHVVDCEAPTYQSYGAPVNNYGYQRHFCVKRVETNKRTQRTTYIRACHSPVGSERVGTCGQESSYRSYGETNLDFCEYCDTHECNGAQGLEKNAFWVGLIPIAVALALRKFNALECWFCALEKDGGCGEKFNASLYPRIQTTRGHPKIAKCEDFLKRISTNKRTQGTVYMRLCHTVIDDEKVGPCAPERLLGGDINVDFCEYCDTD